MPSEWERHEGTWLQWPHDQTDHIHQLKLERVWLMMVDALHAHENVHIIVWDEMHREHVASQLKYFGLGLQNIDYHIMPTDDFWVRDNGPIFVVNQDGVPAITDWVFNGWGDRFAFTLDNQVPGIIGEEISVPVFSPSLVLEGGAVEVNGKGTFMATRTSIIDPDRNPGKSQEKIEQILSDYLGVKHFIWLTGAGRGECAKWGDETDSHIDIIARFTDEATVLYNWADDESDPRYPMLKKHYQELRAARNESGKPLTLVPLPLPKDGVYRITPLEDRKLSALTDAVYSNYLVANGVVLVPVFGNVNDDKAKKIIGEQFPDREVVGIDCVALNEDGGAIHCVTQQQPYVPDLHKHA
jgi:agmatine deiminase